jgi:hypothetical protein
VGPTTAIIGIFFIAVSYFVLPNCFSSSLLLSSKATGLP